MGTGIKGETLLLVLKRTAGNINDTVQLQCSYVTECKTPPPHQKGTTSVISLALISCLMLKEKTTENELKKTVKLMTDSSLLCQVTVR